MLNLTATIKNNKLLFVLSFSLLFSFNGSASAAAIVMGSGASAGPNSIALGEDSNANSTTTNSDLTKPTGQVAIGYHAKATGISSTAFGAYSLSSGFKSTAYGEYTKAEGYKSIAFGADAWSQADYSVAMGSAAKSSGLYSMAYGTNSQSVGNYSTAFGAESKAFALNSLAIGSYSSANKENSIALGSGSIADEGALTNYTGYGLSSLQSSQGEMSVGSSSVKRKITNVAAGSSDTDATNVSQLKSVNDSLTSTITFNASQAVNYGLNSDGSINYMSLSLNRGFGDVVLNGVAKGTVSSNSTQAINGSQLYESNTRISQLESSVTTLNNTSATKDDLQKINDNISTTTAASKSDLNAVNDKVDTNTNSINAIDTQVKTNTTDIGNLKTDVIKNTNDISNLDNKINTAPAGNGQVTSTNDIVDLKNNVGKNTNDINNLTTKTNTNTSAINSLDNKTVQYTANTTKSTIQLKGSNGTTISNVAAGLETTDAANVGQVEAVNSKVSTASKNIADLQEGKSGVVRINNTANKSMAKATGTNSVAVGQNSSASGSNSVAIGADSSDDGRENAVAVGNATNQRTITHVAAGTQGTDAVNVNQLNSQVNASLNSANAYADDLFSGVDHRLKRLEKESNAGIASAMAMATMPQAYAPGKSMVSMGVGNFQSGSALSIGASIVSPGGKIVYKVNGAVDSANNFGAAAGVGYQW